MKVFEILECRVCGQTPCNCTHINEGYAPQGGNYKQGKYHVVVGGKCISEHPNKSEASSAAAKYRKANPSSQPRVKHESELTEGLADEIADKALNGRLSKMSQDEKVKGGWAHPSTIKGPSAAERKKSRDYQRSSAAKKARDAERRKGVNEDVTEGVKSKIAAAALAACVATSGCKVGDVDMGEPTKGSVSGKPHVTKVVKQPAEEKKVTEAAKPNMKAVEAELAAHAQRKIDYEKENGPMVAHELVSHEQRRKQLMKKLSRERSKANNS